jgi:hypothetical protein
VGNRPQHLANNRAVPEYDSEINSPKKMPKRRKYEGKRLKPSCSVRLLRRSRASAINRSVGEFSMLFILAAGSFSNMFTTYSHMLCGCPRQRLETRNQLRKRQEKNEFYFQLRPKNFLTEKMKHVCGRETKKQCVKTFREPTATDSESPQRTDSLLISYASRVDRIRLCAQFLASASGA